MLKHHLAADETARGTLRRRARRRLVWALCAAAAASGCGGGSGRDSDAAARFTPALPLARDALQAALEDWKAGRATERIERLSIPVQVVDKRRRRGQTLEDYEILGESPAESARCFAVRLKLGRPEAEERVRYVVIGIDPLWVFREEDFHSICQWECPPEEEETAETANSGATDSGTSGRGSSARATVDDDRRAASADEPGDSNADLAAGDGVRDRPDKHVSADEVRRETRD
jgi:hypothetical protein